MKIPSKEFAKGVELCLNNATSLLEDAQLLANKGSYGHAVFFWLFLRLKKQAKLSFAQVEELRFGKTKNYMMI
jgi:hypothetical protein